MADNHYKEKRRGIPIEQHDTAAWAGIKELKDISNVNIPDENEIINAKEYVDTNQK